jgi:hypothetical protein
MSNRRKQVRATTDLAQLAMLAPVVVAQRTAKMAQRGTNANAREGRRMVTEKISASSESLFHVAIAVARTQARFSSLLLRTWFMPTASSMVSSMRASALDLSSSAVSPYLRKVKANAKRLRRAR